MTDCPHLRALESESIHLFREAAADPSHRMVMLYSIGKDSSVLWHLAKKAFWPERPPFPLLHIDTGWKFAAMIRFRDALAQTDGVRMIVAANPEGTAQGINPFDTPADDYLYVMKTLPLRKALEDGGFTLAFGGGRRDEDQARAKERMISRRANGHVWDPRAQEPEFWSLCNTRVAPGESLRVFPLSNWTERDIWAYIAAESIPVVPLYFAAARPVVRRGGQWIVVDDDRFRFMPGEESQTRIVRFRSLGCYPLSVAVESDAQTPADILRELDAGPMSERSLRIGAGDDGDNLESKKRQGYF